MKKNLFYTALGLIGLMGALFIGVASADTSCWSTYGGIVPTSTYASNIVYGCDENNIPIISIYGKNGNNGDVGITIKAMNEGTGTVTIGSGYDKSSYGALYQWGNSYPFPNVSDTTTPINSGSSAVSAALYGPNTTSGYYYSGTWIKQNVWDIGYNVNLRGGAGDMGSDRRYSFQNFNTTTFIDANSQDRQVMCPEGYHIPSQGEWHALFYLWGKNYDESKKTSLFENVSLNNLINVSGLDGAGMSFSSDMQIPFANIRVVNTNPQTYAADYGNYWSSSPVNGKYTPNKASIFHFNSNQIITNSSNDRGVGMAVRCFKNSYVKPPQTLTFFTVTVDVSPAEGGSASSGSIEAVSGSSITGTIEAGTGFIKSGDVVLSTVTPNPGYIFSGWTTDCGETLTANCTFTGELKEILYEVEFTGNNVSTGKVEVTSGSVVNLTGNEIVSSDSKDGYLFVGWNTNSGASEGLSNITVTGDITLFSIFQPITYIVSYDANGGIGSIANSGYTYDLSGNLAENTFTKTGYVFSGWMYNNEIYTGNQEIKNLTGINDATIIMVTQWKPITYSVEFTGTDVSGTMSNQEFTYGEAKALTANAFTKTGYIFSGWTYGTTGYADKQNVSNLTTTDGATVTLTAQWTPITYTVHYDANGGIGSMTDSGYTYDLSGNLAENTFTKTGYVFSGWMYNNEIYTGNQEIKNLTGINDASITMVTQWAPIKYSVEFTGTDVSGTMANQNFTYDVTGALTANEFTKTGYIFSGWTYGTTGYTNQQNVINLTTTNNDIITFTAQWTPITYTISFSGNAADATGTAPATINAEYDSGDIAPDNSFTLTGYTFTGWNTESNGSGTGYTTGAELKNLTTTSGANVELYAQWEVNVHKLNFVVDGTTIQSGDVAYAAAISAPAEPKKDCNSFAGWSSSVEGLTTTGTMPDSDVTFTANWNYTCSRSSGGGGGGSSRNTEKTTETQTQSKVDSSTKATDSEDNTQDSSSKSTEGQNQGKTYSDEFQQAYEFAYKHGITTMPTIEQANMEGPLTRIAMAKMLSYYAINVLGLKPDETRVNKFNDVSDQMDAEYNNAVSLAYQLGIMGINMPNNKFRPNDEVTRAEFATALSRMIYGTSDGEYKSTAKYYIHHMEKLVEEGIITKDDPNMKELRGYVMIMLMRSAK